MQSPRAEFYVHSPDFQPDEPLTAEHIARGIAAGTIPESVLIAPVGAQTWSGIETASEIVEALRIARSMRTGLPQRHARGTSSPPLFATGRRVTGTPITVVPVAEPIIALPVPAVAPVVAAAAVPAVADPAGAAPQAKPAEAAKAEDKKEEKKEEKKPLLDPKYKLLPIKIFGACVAVGIVETIVALLVR